MWDDRWVIKKKDERKERKNEDEPQMNERDNDPSHWDEVRVVKREELVERIVGMLEEMAEKRGEEEIQEVQEVREAHEGAETEVLEGQEVVGQTEEMEWVKSRRDTFEDCPACGKGSLRARVTWYGWVMCGGLVEYCSRLHFNVRCLKCGYSNQNWELDPYYDEEEEYRRYCENGEMFHGSMEEAELDNFLEQARHEQRNRGKRVRQENRDGNITRVCI